MTYIKVYANIYFYTRSMKVIVSCSQLLSWFAYNFVSCLLLMNMGGGTVLLFMSHTLSFVSILHATSYSLFPVACWDNARRDVAFMSLGVIAESVTSSLASNFSADDITPRQICTFRSLRDHRSIKKDIIYLRLQYLIGCYIIEIIL